MYSQPQIIWEMKHDDKEEKGGKMSKYDVPPSRPNGQGLQF